MDITPDSIITFTGKWVRPLALRIEDIDIIDIAHALSMKCRFSGHCKRYYSVAQHSVLMARLDLPGPPLWRLVHDSAEAYLPDIASPIKDRFPLIVRAEKHILGLLAEKLNLTSFDEVRVAIHEADVAMVVWEGHNNMVLRGLDVIWEKRSVVAGLQEVLFQSWNPETAEREFLTEFDALTGEGNQCGPT